MSLYDQRLIQLVKLLREFHPRKIYAFGSLTRSKGSRDSDIDIAAVLDSEVDTIELKRKFALRLWETHYPFDLEPDIHMIPVNIFTERLRSGDPFITNVAGGKLIYES